MANQSNTNRTVSLGLVLEKFKGANKVNKAIFVLLAFLMAMQFLLPGRQPMYMTPSGSEQRKIEEALIQKIGAWRNGTRPVIKELEMSDIVAGPYQGGKLLNLAYRTLASSKDSFLHEMKTVIPYIFNTPALSAVNEVVIRPHVDVQDMYGTASEAQIGKLVIGRSVAQKVNWDNVTYEGLERVLKAEGQFQFRELR